MFEATSQDTHDWSYTKTTILDAGSGTVGDVSVADVNGDGYLEVVIPAYNRNEVNMFTFAPQPPVIG